MFRVRFDKYDIRALSSCSRNFRNLKEQFYGLAVTGSVNVIFIVPRPFFFLFPDISRGKKRKHVFVALVSESINIDALKIEKKDNDG